MDKSMLVPVLRTGPEVYRRPTSGYQTRSEGLSEAATVQEIRRFVVRLARNKPASD